MVKKVQVIKAAKTKEKDVKLDRNGFFVIEIDNKEKCIRVEYYENVYKKEKIVSGNLKKIFTGKKADALCDTISKNTPVLNPEHYMYLGREIQRAENSLRNNKKYVQGGC